MRLRCKACGKEYEVDAFTEEQGDEVEQAVGHVRADRF